MRPILNVRVYWNLRKKMFSVQCKKTNRVITHTNLIFLEDVKFNVRKGGRERVLREKRKNVHAFVEGLCDLNLRTWQSGLHNAFNVKYDPHVNESFVNVENNEPVYAAKIVCMSTRDNSPIVQASTFRTEERQGQIEELKTLLNTFK